MEENQEKKLDNMMYALVGIALAVCGWIVFGFPLQFLLIFTSIGSFTSYLLLTIITLLIGFLFKYIIQRATQSDKQVAVLSLCSIIPTTVVVGIGLSMVNNLNKQLGLMIEKSTDSVAQSGTTGLVSILNQNIPIPIVAVIIMFVFFSIPFAMKYIKEKEYGILLYYSVGLLITVLLFLLIGYFMISAIIGVHMK